MTKMPNNRNPEQPGENGRTGHTKWNAQSQCFKRRVLVQETQLHNFFRSVTAWGPNRPSPLKVPQKLFVSLRRWAL